MPTDEPVAAPAASDLRAGFTALLDTARGALAVRWREARRPVRLAGALAIVAALAATWWFVRPRPRPAIEDLLPRAAPAGSVPAATGAASSAPTLGGGGGATTTVAPIVVHVVGAVHAPGVVRVPAGARVLAAVEAAGGLRDDADPARVNLAAKLVDGQRVVVPVVGEVPPVAVDGGAGTGAGAPSGGAGGAPSPESPVNLNEATAEQLDALPGIGPATAAAIVAHRTQHGPFRTIDALADVRGIGPAKLEQLRPYLVV